MVLDKMVAICLDFKWFQIQFKIQTIMQPNLFLTIRNPDCSRISDPHGTFLFSLCLQGGNTKIGMKTIYLVISEN